jgi:fluoride exporter
MPKLLHLVFGGAIGTVARYALSGIIHRVFGSGFPYGTLIVNLMGCLLIGFLAAITNEKFVLGANARLLLIVGFCGAFTTFSTFILETAHLIRDGNTLHAFANAAVSVAIGFFIFRIGVFLGEMV